MKNVTLIVNKAYVYDEVAKTTSYAGAKMMAEDSTAYDRIFTTDEDRLLLERFWNETCNMVTNRLKPFIISIDSQPISHGIDLSRDYKVELGLSSSYDDVLTEAINTSLFNFFVAMIVSKWFIVANKAEAESYAVGSAGIMEDVMRKIYYKKKPQRVTPYE
jgi:hypothetical protein